MTTSSDWTFAIAEAIAGLPSRLLTNGAGASTANDWILGITTKSFSLCPNVSRAFARIPLIVS